MITRVRAFAAIVAGCGLASAAAVGAAVIGQEPAQVSGGAAGALERARAEDRGVVVVRSLEPATRDQLAIVPAERPHGRAIYTGLRCERAHFAADSGICVARGGDLGGGYRAQVFGADLRVRGDTALAGIPSRTRVSPDGRLGSVTMFVAGHAYTTAGEFSTETTLLDLRTGRRIADLEDFTVSRRGRVVTAEDVNFWGVTFERDGNGFFATLATGGNTYLVHGSIRDRTMRTLHTNVECPALSPDGTRIAFKKRVGSGEVPWRLTVLDLATMRETPLAEARGLDDQAEWLDDRHVLYRLDDETRVVDADGGGAPRTLRARADSPAAVRW